MASNFELIDRAMDGKLAERLRGMRAEGMSLEAMSLALKAEGFDVGISTVQRWCQRAGIPTHRVPATEVAS